MSAPVYGRKWFPTSENDTTTLQKVSFERGFVCGQDPAMAYGVPAPEDLDSVAYMAGLIEGRSQARVLAAKTRKTPLEK
jgi:hypothetical protein